MATLSTASTAVVPNYELSRNLSANWQKKCFQKHSLCIRRFTKGIQLHVSASANGAASSEKVNGRESGPETLIPDENTVPPQGVRAESARRPTVKAESTDWIASNLTRRFGLGAGLAWVAFLAFGVVSEQVKTRREVFMEERDTRDVEDSPEVTITNGIRFTDLRLGGGASPQRGDLVLISLMGKVVGSNETFIDTTAAGERDLVFTFGVRPYVKGVCEGLETAMVSMRVGGKRRVFVPAEVGFGNEGADFGYEVTVPSNVDLEYVVELKRASISPS